MKKGSIYLHARDSYRQEKIKHFFGKKHVPVMKLEARYFDRHEPISSEELIQSYNSEKNPNLSANQKIKDDIAFDVFVGTEGKYKNSIVAIKIRIRAKMTIGKYLRKPMSKLLLKNRFDL